MCSVGAGISCNQLFKDYKIYNDFSICSWSDTFYKEVKNPTGSECMCTWVEYKEQNGFTCFAGFLSKKCD
jgi:hypothetical protein